MEAVPSFAPLAARLAARADEIRPVDGAEASVANFMALFVCAILQMLIALCEALDARAAADARLAAIVATRAGMPRPVVTARAGCGTMPAAGRRPRLALVSAVQDVGPVGDDAWSGMAGAAIGMAGAAPSRPWAIRAPRLGPNWKGAGPPVAMTPRKAAWRLGIRLAYFVAIS